jgi:hypothetical protein
MDKRNIIYLFVLLALMLFLPGCGLLGGDPGENGDSTDPADPAPSMIRQENLSGEGYFYRLTDLSAPVREWVDNAANHLFLGQSRVIDGYLYILVTYGPQPTGGFTVEITEVQVGEQAVNVEVDYTKPDPDDPVTQAYTYPYDLVLIPAVDLPVAFTALGDETYVMGLFGVDLLEPITSSSYGIKLFAPSDGETVRGDLLFRGVASVFEGTVSYRLKDEQGEILTEGFTTAGMGDWYYFQVEIPLSGLIREEQPALLELFTISPKDGSEQDKVSLQLIIAP